MPAAIPENIRKRIVEAYRQKLGTQAILAKTFGVSPKSVKNFLRLDRQGDSLAPKPHAGGHQAAYSPKKAQELRKLIEQNPSLTLLALRKRTGVDCSLVAVHNALKKLDLRYKKNALRSRTRAS